MMYYMIGIIQILSGIVIMNNKIIKIKKQKNGK